MQLNYELTPKLFWKGLDQASRIWTKPIWYVVHVVLGLLFGIFITLLWWGKFFKQQQIMSQTLLDDYGELLYQFLNDVQHTNEWLVISVIITVIISFLYTYGAIALQRKKAFGKHSPILQNNHIELREEGLFHQSDVGSDFSFYEKLYAVEQSKDFVLIFFDRGIVSHIIPKRAFADQAQVDEFVAIIRHKMSQKTVEK